MAGQAYPRICLAGFAFALPTIKCLAKNGSIWYNFAKAKISVAGSSIDEGRFCSIAASVRVLIFLSEILI